MRKGIALLLAAAMLLALAACGGNAAENASVASKVSESETSAASQFESKLENNFDTVNEAEASNNENSKPIEEATEPEADSNLVEFDEPLLAYEDGNVKIEILNFYVETVNWSEGPADE